MSKHISKLRNTTAGHTAKPLQSDEAVTQRPRLAERLVELAPLARAPLVAESESEESDDGLSRLSRSPGAKPYAEALFTEGQRNALVPRQAPALPRVREPVRLSPVGVSRPARFGAEPDGGQGFAGFLVGLGIATAIGIVLYAVLV